MHLSDEEISEEEMFPNEGHKPKKRKIGREPKPMKKVKYEDIPEDGSVPKSEKKQRFKPPTTEEINHLRETEALYSNNLLRLQIDELLAAIEVKNKHKLKLNNWLEAFKSHIDAMSEFEPTLLSNIRNVKHKGKKQKSILRNFRCPIKTDKDINVSCLRPESLEYFGLYNVNASSSKRIVCNINLKMPKAGFHVKDFVNNRYFVKRYFYLAYIGEHLKASSLCHDINWDYHGENLLLPILKIAPNNSDKIICYVYATPSEGYFKATRFLPGVNNVKSNLCFDDLSLDEESLQSSGTPYYNSLVAHDVTLSVNSSFVTETLIELPNVQQGIKLINVWLKQRQLDQGLCSFGEDLVLYIVTYLVAKKKVNKFMSSYQVLRNFWNFMASFNGPISLSDEVKPEDLNKFKEVFDVVMLDRTGCYNIAAFLGGSVLGKVQYECELAIKLVEDTKTNSFDSLFLSKIPFYMQYDVVIELKSLSSFIDQVTNTEQEKSKFIGCHILLVLRNILNVLKKGFNKRALHIVPYIKKLETLQFGSTEHESFSQIFIGINLNPDCAFSFIELGPTLNDPQEKEFREFWTHLSSDRRFRDGTVRVAVVFECVTIKDKRQVVKKILSYLLNEKLGLLYSVYYDELEEVLVNKKIDAWYQIGTNEETTLKIIAASDDLGKKIRNFKMSLSVTGVQGTSDVYSYTDVFPQIPTCYQCGKTVTSSRGNHIIFNEKRLGMVPKYVKPIENVLQLEHSSKWPRSLEAIKHMKTAFYLEMSKLLNQEKIITSVTPDHLDVFFQGLVFRYKLYVPLEIGFLKKEVLTGGIVSYKDSEESIAADIELSILPKITAALKGVQSQNPSYGLSTCLIKRWLRSQLLDNFHFPDTVINLLNAFQYVNRSSYLPVNSPQVAFLRFLKFFVESQWNLQPVVINFNEELSKEKLVELDSAFQANRDAFPHLYIVTPYDDGKSVFSKRAPTKEVLLRVKSLAEATMTFIENIIVNEALFGTLDLFLPNWEGYNVIIHIKPLLNPKRYEQLDKFEENKINIEEYKQKNSRLMPIIDFNPIEIFIKELREHYGEYAIFFYDYYGGNSIGVLWKPAALEKKPFKVTHAKARKLEGDYLVLNIEAIVEDFYILGKDLIKSIDVK